MEMLGQAGWGLLDNLLEYLRFGIFCYLVIRMLGMLRLKNLEKSE